MAEAEDFLVRRVLILEKTIEDAHIYLDTRAVPRRRSMDEPSLKLYERIMLMVGELPTAEEKETKAMQDDFTRAMDVALDDHG